MRFLKILPTLFIGAALAAACGGENMGEAQASDMDVAATPQLGCYIARGTMAEAQQRPSPLTEMRFSFEGGEGLLCYGAPSANGREIMGGLVPFGELWRAGANEATTLHLTGPASIGGVALEAGSYSIYTLPSDGEWEFFVNTDHERWGIPISDEVRAGEIGSFTAAPEAIDSMVETLTYSFEPNAEGTMGDLVMQWENTQVKFHVHPGGM